jgi:hypothetical protein
MEFFKQQREISMFCTSQEIEWSLILERTPHFGDLWESAVRSVKPVLGEAKLTFEEFATVLAPMFELKTTGTTPL